jgi:hypothetical protein
MHRFRRIEGSVLDVLFAVLEARTNQHAISISNIFGILFGDRYITLHCIQALKLVEAKGQNTTLSCLSHHRF